MMEKREIEIRKQKILTDKLIYFMKGNLDAVRFCIDIVYIAHLWDDLIDRDIERSGHDINQAFRIALMDIPSNPFYYNNMSDLRPLMMNAILQWQDANILERGTNHERHMAYMLRASFLQIFNYCAYLVGGPEWVKEIGPDMRRLYEEPLESFMEEMNNA